MEMAEIAIDEFETGTKQRTRFGFDRNRFVYGRERIVQVLLFMCAMVSVLTTVGIIIILSIQAFEFFKEVPIWKFLTDTQWTPLFSDQHFGILPLLSGTFLTSVIALLVSVPLGLVIAIYLSEYAASPVRKVIKPYLEILAGIPTI